jgi:hypothetical protein
MALFGKPTLSGVLATFDKTMGDLATILNANSARQTEISDTIKGLESEDKDLVIENLRAQKVLDNIRNLVAA